MPAAPDDISTLGKIGASIAAGAGTIVAAVWTTLNKRIARVERQCETKADRIEMDRQRDNISGIFGRLGKLEVSTARIEEQIERYTADIENEKRTRAESNRLLNAKLDRLLERRKEVR